MDKLDKLIFAHESLNNIIIDYVNTLDRENDKLYIEQVFDICATAKEAIRQQIYALKKER